MPIKRSSFEIAKHATIWVFVALTFYPFYYTFITSFKNLDQFFHSFWSPTLPLHWENYAVAWRELRIYIYNSLYVTTAGSLGTVLGCALSAFAFARGDFPLKNVLFYAIFSIMMIPSVLVLIPLFMWVKDLHLLNSRTGLVLTYIAMGQPFGMIVIKSFFEEVPKDFFESARIDGASFLQQFISIAAPLAGSIIGTVIIINVLYIWNDYLWPTVVVELAGAQADHHGPHGLLRAVQHPVRVPHGRLHPLLAAPGDPVLLHDEVLRGRAHVRRSQDVAAARGRFV